jgi:hypothetical protein
MNFFLGSKNYLLLLPGVVTLQKKEGKKKKNMTKLTKEIKRKWGPT